MEVNKIAKEIQLKRQLFAIEKNTNKRSKINDDIKRLEIKKQLAQLKRKS